MIDQSRKSFPSKTVEALDRECSNGKDHSYMAVMDHVPERAHHDTPHRSYIQRMDALGKANDIRSYRADVKRDLRAGRESIHDLLLDPPERLETAKIFDFLLATPKYGRVKVNKVLVQCRISPSKTIGGLSQRQRAELVSMLRR